VQGKFPNSQLELRICDAVAKINQFSSQLLNSANYSQALKLLKHAEMWVIKFSNKGCNLLHSKNTIFNTIACIYKRMSDFQNAIFYTEKAVNICESNPSLPQAAMTFLNASAILSDMGKHKESLERAKQAVNVLIDNSVDNKNYYIDPVNYDKYTLLSMAYHNIALQEEIISGPQKAISNYEHALNLLAKSTNNEPELRETIEKSLKNARRSLPSRKYLIRAETLTKKSVKITPKKNRPLTSRKKHSMSKNKHSGFDNKLIKKEPFVFQEKPKTNYFSINPQRISLQSSLSWLSPKNISQPISIKSRTPLISSNSIKLTKEFNTKIKPEPKTKRVSRQSSWKAANTDQTANGSMLQNAQSCADFEKLKNDLRKEIEEDLQKFSPKYNIKVNNFIKISDDANNKALTNVIGDENSKNEIEELRKIGVLQWDDQNNNNIQIYEENIDEKPTISNYEKPVKSIAEIVTKSQEIPNKTQINTIRDSNKPLPNKIKINLIGQKSLIVPNSKIIKHQKCISMPFSFTQKKTKSIIPPPLNLPSNSSKDLKEKSENIYQSETKRWIDLYKAAYFNNEKRILIRYNNDKQLLELKLFENTKENRLLFSMRYNISCEITGTDAKNIWEEITLNSKSEISNDAALFFKKVKEFIINSDKNDDEIPPLILVNDKIIDKPRNDNKMQENLRYNSKIEETPEKIKQKLKEDEIKPLSGRMSKLQENQEKNLQSPDEKLIQPLSKYESNLENIEEQSPKQEDTKSNEEIEFIKPLGDQKKYSICENDQQQALNNA